MSALTPKHRPWTFMVYMAGDNGKVFSTASGRKKLMAEMTTAGYRDIWEMGKVGTTDACAVTCLFDTIEDTYLVEVRKGNGLADSEVQMLREVNTGDPRALREFVVRSMESYPADHYALVIWNHGTGWLDIDAYATVRSQEELDYRPHSAIFRTTPRKLQEGDTTRPIAFDDSSKDFLDTKDLRQVFSEVQALTGRKLDLVGMDACLMAMVEGARELAPYTDYFVASQEVEPMDGWPYAEILTALNAQPGMQPAELAERVVRDYARSHNAQTRQDETVTQSAVSLARTAETERLCRALVDAILGHEGDYTLRSAVQEARDSAQRFQDRSLRDLGDFAKHLADNLDLSFYDGLPEAARALYDHLEARGPDAAVLQVAYRPKYEVATGMSVYLPSPSQAAQQRRKALDIYRNLFFPQATGWSRLIEWLDPDTF